MTVYVGGLIFRPFVVPCLFVRSIFGFRPIHHLTSVNIGHPHPFFAFDSKMVVIFMLMFAKLCSYCRLREDLRFLILSLIYWWRVIDAINDQNQTVHSSALYSVISYWESSSFFVIASNFLKFDHYRHCSGTFEPFLAWWWSMLVNGIVWNETVAETIHSLCFVSKICLFLKLWFSRPMCYCGRTCLWNCGLAGLLCALVYVGTLIVSVMWLEIDAVLTLTFLFSFFK